MRSRQKRTKLDSRGRNAIETLDMFGLLYLQLIAVGGRYIRPLLHARILPRSGLNDYILITWSEKLPVLQMREFRVSVSVFCINYRSRKKMEL
jgi:hypothetical protein